MIKYLGRRVIALAVILTIVSFGSFSLIHLLPGDIATVILGTGNTPANRIALYKQLGLDKGLFSQYSTWLGNIFQLNFGNSFIDGTSVSTTIGTALPIDFEMILISQVMAFVIAIPLAMKAAKKPNGLFDRIATGTSFTMLSVPPFIFIVLLVLVVSINLQIPGTGPASFVTFGQDPFHNLVSLVLPSIVLGIGSTVVYFRVLRSDLVSTLQEEFITMARSKGLTRRRIMWRHAFRPSSIALLGTAGLNIGGLIAGGFIVEYLMQIPGIGYMLILAINKSDFLLVQGIVMTIATLIVLLNFLIDFLFGIIDPRITRD